MSSPAELEQLSQLAESGQLDELRRLAAADELDELDGQADELERGSVAEAQTAEIKPDHRPRPDAYPDELGQLLCDACETLCSPGRPCHCCWVEQLCQEDGDG